MPDSAAHFEIICTRCGQRSEDASAFCGGCGTFLEWDGERVESARAGPNTAGVHSVSIGSTAVKPAVKPAVPVYRLPPAGERTAPRRAQVGDLACTNCGRSNEATRKFCRRCGTTLRDPAAVDVASWWHRLFVRRAQPPPTAGSRPAPPAPSGGRSQGGRILGRLVVLAVVIIVVLVAAVPSLRTRIRRSIHPRYPTIALQSATATNAGGCPAPRIKDNSTVYWNTHASSGPIQVLTVAFAAGFQGDLNKIGVTPLAPDAPATAGSALPYPEQLALSAGTTALSPGIVLSNPPKFRSFTVKAIRPQTIQIRALSIDPGAPADACAQTALIFYDRT